MKHRTSIDRSIRWITAFIACVIAMVTSWSAFVSLQEERGYWEKQIGNNLQSQAVSIVKREFTNLATTMNGFSSSNITYGFAKYGKINHLERLFSNTKLHQENLTGVVLIDSYGSRLYSNSVVSDRLDELINQMFLPIGGVHYSPASDFGLLFAEGRIFIYHVALISTPTFASNVGTIVGYREVDSDMLNAQSSAMGLEFNIQYTSASRRIVKVSYQQPVEVETTRISETSTHLSYEYQVTYAGGTVQPASFVVYAPLTGTMPSQFILPAAILMFIVGAVLSVWMIIRQFVVLPSLDFARLVTQSDHFSQATALEKELPLELNLVYNQFRQLYDDIDRQSKFSEQILEAMGDVIITVNIEGEIEYVNPAALRWLGFSEDELLGEPLEMHISSRNYQDAGIVSWLYRANIDKERVEAQTQLTVLSRSHECFDCDVICQPVDLNQTTKYHSTAVVVIRLNGSKACDVANCGLTCAGKAKPLPTHQ